MTENITVTFVRTVWLCGCSMITGRELVTGPEETTLILTTAEVADTPAAVATAVRE